MPPPLRTSVTAWSAIPCAFWLDSGESTTSPMPSRSTKRLCSSPTRSLAASILTTLSWIFRRIRPAGYSVQIRHALVFQPHALLGAKALHDAFLPQPERQVSALHRRLH